MVGVKGLRGQLKVEPLSDREERLQAGAEVFLEGEAQPRLISETEDQRRVRVVALDGVTSREAAERLVGRYLEIEPPELPPGSHYWHELIGITVFDPAGRELGRIVEVFRAGENEVYRVVGEGDEILVPALREVVTELDVAARSMVVRLETEEIR